jgi:hypothetical protein
LSRPYVKGEAGVGQATRSKTAVVCEPDQAFPEIGRRRGVEGVREQRPALRLPERLEVAMTPCDVHDVYVVRKQLYISEEHERALKARVRELGISEAELVRRMLDSVQLDG